MPSDWLCGTLAEHLDHGRERRRAQATGELRVPGADKAKFAADPWQFAPKYGGF